MYKIITNLSTKLGIPLGGTSNQFKSNFLSKKVPISHSKSFNSSQYDVSNLLNLKTKIDF